VPELAHAGHLVDRIRGLRRVEPTSVGLNPDWDSSLGRLKSAPPGNQNDPIHQEAPMSHWLLSSQNWGPGSGRPRCSGIEKEQGATTPKSERQFWQAAHGDLGHPRCPDPRAATPRSGRSSGGAGPARTVRPPYGYHPHGAAVGPPIPRENDRFCTSLWASGSEGGTGPVLRPGAWERE
jgi:hypothetical protein